MRRVLHILPHRGGGAEQYIHLLGRLDGYVHEPMSLSSGPRPLSAALSVPARWPGIAVRARGRELVHAHGDVAGMLTLPILASRPSVVTTHGLHFLRRARGAGRRLARRGVEAAVSAATRTVCTSQAELDELRAIVKPETARRLVLVRNGIELPPAVDLEERQATRSGLGLADDSVAALYLGGLDPRKDPLTAVRAAADVRRRGLPLVLLVAGDGPLRGEIETHAGEAVRVLGFRRDTAQLLAAADLFVMPSAREGASLALLEAMGHGLPAVVSDGAGNPEAVGDTGIVVSFGEEWAFASALAALAADPAERRRRGAAARERVESQFDAASFVHAIERVYVDVVAAGEPAAQGA
jgi:glycosyltransferase involved in cell wall biosynthesis